MKLIPLSKKSKTNSGKYFTMVDDEDYEFLNKFSWHRSSMGYVITAKFVGRVEGRWKYRAILMHRLLMGVDEFGIYVDHKDHNPLNNQKNNLRVCSNSQNNQNRSITKNKTTTMYKGVSLYRLASYYKNNNTLSVIRWRAYIKIDKKQKWLGIFDNEIDAAKAYDMAAKKYFGEFANLNFKE